MVLKPAACVMTKITDYTPLLKEAIAEAKAAGFEAAAHDLEQAVFAAFTTSSEMLQEHGLAIRRFLENTRGSLPRPIKAKLNTCLTETELASSGWRKLLALLKRCGAPG